MTERINSSVLLSIEHTYLLLMLWWLMVFLFVLGLSKKLINNLMSLDIGESFTWEEYGLDIRDTSITWLNDLETDERYRRWPSSFMELLRPTYPGMLRNLRRNIYNYVSLSELITLSILSLCTMFCHLSTWCSCKYLRISSINFH